MKKFIRKLRVEHGLNQEQLASLLGVTQGTLSKIENGRQSMSDAAVLRLVKQFKISRWELENVFRDRMIGGKYVREYGVI
jgi:transcriptional regulator with XRE-family HTH domain